MLEKALKKTTEDALSIEGNFSLSILNLIGLIVLRLE